MKFFVLLDSTLMILCTLDTVTFSFLFGIYNACSEVLQYLSSLVSAALCWHENHSMSQSEMGGVLTSLLFQVWNWYGLNRSCYIYCSLENLLHNSSRSMFLIIINKIYCYKHNMNIKCISEYKYWLIKSIPDTHVSQVFGSSLMISSCWWRMVGSNILWLFVSVSLGYESFWTWWFVFVV